MSDPSLAYVDYISGYCVKISHQRSFDPTRFRPAVTDALSGTADLRELNWNHLFSTIMRPISYTYNSKDDLIPYFDISEEVYQHILLVWLGCPTKAVNGLVLHVEIP